MTFCLRIAGLCGLLWIILAPTASYGDEAAADLRIVVDVSRSMHKADPEHLRGAGIELLSRQMHAGQSAGIWAYSQLTQQLVTYGPSDGLWKQIAAIHGRNLSAHSRQANLPAGLEAATWDLDKSSRSPTHLVLFSNGRIDTGRTTLEHQNARQLLLNGWASKLRQARISVHTVAIGAAGDQDDMDLLKQISDLSGGLHKQVNELGELQDFLMDVVQLMQTSPQIQADDNGRFQIAPGASMMNVVWLADMLNMDESKRPALVQPDGTRLDRLTPLVNGRWVLSRDFEMVTLQNPQVGWWRLDGIHPRRLSVLGEIEIRVDGVSTPVIPTEESHALIRLFSEGQLVADNDFLNLVNLRAWLSDDRKRVPLPVDRVEGGFQAYFVNLADGAYELEVEVAAPTFKRHRKVPFVASNPLRVDFKHSQSGDVVAWLNFNHAAVDYSSVRAAAKVRKPPQVGTIVPAQRLPAGFFQIPIKEQSGVVEISFTISGNYLNKKGFFLKTRPQTVTLPMAREASFRFAADGKLLSQPTDIVETEAQDNGLETSSDVAAPVAPESAPPAQVLSAQPQEPPWPKIPLWFVALITLVNAAVGGLVWWMNKPKPLDEDLAERLRASKAENARDIGADAGEAVGTA